MSETVPFHSTETCRRSEFTKIRHRNVFVSQQRTRSPSSHRLCSFMLPSAGSRFSDSHLKHLHSICQQWMLLNWQSATSEIHSTAWESRFISPVTQNHCYRFSMRAHWGVETTMLPSISKGIERWQGHRRSIRALKLLCAHVEPWSCMQSQGSITAIHFPIWSSRISGASKVLCSASPGVCWSRI